MNKYLLFRLYAPLCSWGDIAVGEVRPSYTHPSKSAIIGLLSAALGIKRSEEEKIGVLCDSYGFAVLVESFGKPLVDYHTAQVPSGKERYAARKDELMVMPKSDLNTILSWRSYRTDAIYTVILRECGQCPWNTEQVRDALLWPAFTLYLGRKSCPPSLPLDPRIVEAVSLLEAVQEAVFNDYSCKIPERNKEKKDLFFEECFCSEIAGYDRIVERRDLPLSRKRWQFDTRKEYHAVIGG